MSPVHARPAPDAAPAWSVRRADSADAAALALLGAATFLETYAGELAGGDIVAHCRARHAAEVYDAWLAAEDHALWLAEAGQGGAPVGYAVLAPSDIPLAQPGDLELKRIYVLSRWHGAGPGRELMRQAAEAARDRRARRLLIGAYARNARALAFYARCGFALIGQRSFTVGATTYEDDVVMALALS